MDVVIFTGNGVTAAIDKLISSLGIKYPVCASINEVNNDNDIPIVFTSSYEHHSNLLSWRETVAEVVTIRYHPYTGVCLHDLHYNLCKYRTRKCKIGSFSACSNVTGIMTDVDAVSVLMHRHDGVVFFDYATAAPYLKVCIGLST